MYDPCTVAWEIKSPFVTNRHVRPDGEVWKYRRSLITIWHVDPEENAHKKGLRGDDSCGWFHPPTTPEERERVRKLGEEEFYDLFGRRRATAEGKDYASICFEPTAYDAVYWAWRRIKREFARRKPVWKYGRTRAFLTAAELEEIYSLACNPVDNVQSTVARVHDKESCADFFLIVYCCYLRFNRPWYKHPRWHLHHWRLQVHPWQALRRWLFTRCAGCGKRFPYGYSPVSMQWHSEKPGWCQGEKAVYHSECCPPLNAKVPDRSDNVWMGQPKTTADAPATLQ